MHPSGRIRGTGLAVFQQAFPANQLRGVMYFWRSLFESLSSGTRPPGQQTGDPGEGGAALFSRMILAFDRWAKRNFADPS